MGAESIVVNHATTTGTGSKAKLVHDEWELLEETIPHSKWIHADEFKAFLLRLYESFPMMRVSQTVLDQNVPNQKVQEYLLEAAYIVRVEDSSTGLTDAAVKMYSIGPNAFPLISAWQTERLTKYMLYVAIATMVVAVLSFILLVIPYVKHST